MNGSPMPSYDGQPIQHALKTWPEFYEAVASGVKTFELRKDDRAFRVGDLVQFTEYEPRTEQFSGQYCTMRITYILRNPSFLREGICAFAMEKP